MYLFRARAAGACALILGLALNSAIAQSQAVAAATASPLTLGEAIERALAANPALRGFGFDLKAQDARIIGAGQRPATEASMELENFLGSGEDRGLDSAEATFRLSQVIELGGKRNLRTAAAQAGRNVLSVEQQAAQLDVLAEVTRRFILIAAHQEQLELTRNATEVSRETVKDVERRVSAARSPEAELLRAQAALATAELDERSAEQQLEVARRQLAALWGEPDDRFGVITADLYRLPSPVEFESLARRLDANPDFLRFTSEARLREAEIRLARSQRRPDLQVSGGVRRLEATNDQAFVLGVSVPLFSGRRAAPAIAEATARRDRLDVDRQVAVLRARTQLFGLYQELRQAIAETRTVQDTILPRLEKALEQTDYAYERGRYSYLELVDAQRTWQAARRALIEAAERAQTLQVEIERLTGEPLANENNSNQERP